MSLVDPIVIRPDKTKDITGQHIATDMLIKSRDARFSMVFLFIHSDSYRRILEHLDASTWDPETSMKVGISNGSVYVIQAPIEKGLHVYEIINEWVDDHDTLVDEKLRRVSSCIPGRSIVIIHERNRENFKRLYNRHAHFHLGDRDHLHFKKNVFTGRYSMDVYSPRYNMK